MEHLHYTIENKTDNIIDNTTFTSDELSDNFTDETSSSYNKTEEIEIIEKAEKRTSRYIFTNIHRN